MFGSFPTLANIPSKVKVDPKDIPPPTPVNLPRYQPFAQDDVPVDPAQVLSKLLRQTGRTTAALGPLGLSAIGLDLKLDVGLQDLIPDVSYVPEFVQWRRLSQDEAQTQNESTRRPLRTGNFSPGCSVYLERKKELSNSNEDAFRTVRRLSPPKGKQQARLGNAYEFYRCLELFTSFWDDPTQPLEMPPSPELMPSEASGPPQVSQESLEDSSKVIRTSAGQSMPPEYRNGLMASFLKLVAYDFGCNVSISRVEPRLHMSSPAGKQASRKSYCPSRCQFVFQGPQSREAARAGLVYGPLAAVSARPTIDFTAPDIETAQSLDLAREVVAALITAQHRAREGRNETRFGDGEWWTTKPRWGGGSGGPIGREIEHHAARDDKDTRPEDADGMPLPTPKKSRKNMSIYDNYRMVRPPASTWDKKARYEAIGRQKGTEYDDIFVLSSLFHHVSVLRVRVPTRLLAVIDGAPETDVSQRSWGKLQAWRSRWHDLFDIDQRVAAMELVWAMMEYQMRQDTGHDEDVVMA